MTLPLPAAPRAAAEGLYTLETATGLIIAHGTRAAAIDRDAAISALHAGELPSPGGQRRVLLLPASLADQAPVSLGDAITGIDARNVGLLVKAVPHAAGRRQFPR